MQGNDALAGERAQLVERASRAVEHAPEEPRADRNVLGLVGGAAPRAWHTAGERVCVPRRERHDQRAGGQAVDVVLRHQVEALLGKSDHFRFHAVAVREQHGAAAADRELEPRCFEDHAGHPGEPAADYQRIGGCYRLAAVVQVYGEVHGTRVSAG
jgi:hypothetical protein